MNLLKPIKSLINHLILSSFHDRVVSFLATKLETSNACLLITDGHMESVYAHVMDKLRCQDGGLLVRKVDDLPNDVTEAIIIHSLFDFDLMQRIADAPNITRIVYVARCADNASLDSRKLKELGSNDAPVTLILAYEEKDSWLSPPRLDEADAVYNRLINSDL